NFTKALALWTRTRSHNVALERTLYFLDFTSAATTGTGDRLGLGGRAGAFTAVAHDCGIYRDGLAHAGIGFFQRNARAQQRVIAGLNARAGAAALSAGTAEELGEDISQAAAAEAAAAKATLAALLLHWVRAHIHD